MLGWGDEERCLDLMTAHHLVLGTNSKLQFDEETMRIAVIFGTTEGQVHKLAGYLGDMLRERGAIVEVLDGEIMPRETSLAEYDGVLIGTSVHAGAHQRFIIELADLHQRELNQIPSALFSVSIDPTRDLDEEEADQYNDYFSDQTHWNPVMEATFRGALPKNHYGFMKSLRSEALTRRRHAEIDPEHDYEYMDHITAEGFVDEFIDFLELSETQQPGANRPAP